MSYEDSLRANTKSTEQIEKEANMAVERQIINIAKDIVAAFKWACKGKAEKGKNSIEFGIPFHIKGQVHGYKTNDDYIYDSYGYGKSGCSFYNCNELQKFIYGNNGIPIDCRFAYPYSYYLKLESELKKELKRNGFTNAKIYRYEGRYKTKQSFFKDKKVFEPFTWNGIKYFHLIISTQW